MTTNKNTKQDTNGIKNMPINEGADHLMEFFKSHVIVCGIPTNKKEEE